MIRVAIIEDDTRIRDWLVEGLRADPEFTCILQAGSVEAFLERATGKNAFNTLLLDISLPGISGLEAIGKLKARFPEVQIIVFTVYDDSQKIFEAIRGGAKGYLLKNMPIDQVKESIRQVFRGEAALNPSVARKILNYFHPDNNAGDSLLTPKEREVVELLVKGYYYKEIADQMDVSINTINFHVRNVYRKLQVNSRTEIINKRLQGNL